MKGNVSKELLALLRDGSARAQLREYLINGRSGRVVVGEKQYRVQIDVRNSVVPGGSAAAK